MLQRSYVRLAARSLVTGVIVLAFASTIGLCREQRYMGQVPKDHPVVSMSRPGGAGSDVSLYTGQHTEQFPLYSIPAGALGAVNLSLSYSGNVYQNATLLNDEAQASWTGLGLTLDLGTNAIICDHKSTQYYQDDDYYMSGVGSGLVKLIDSGSFFYPADGTRLRLERHLATVGSYDYVIGWKVLAEDGRVLLYGDSAVGGPVRSSTWYELHWRDHIGVGISDGDMLQPTQWHLRKVQLGDSTYISYEYDQHETTIRVLTSWGSTSDSNYTVDLYPKSIETSAGYKLEFFAGPREDFMSREGPASYAQYRNVRLDSLQLSHDSKLLSRSVLTYSYLYAQEDSTRKKVILNGMKHYGPDGPGLPPTIFDYYDDDQLAWFGSMSSITYPEGAVKVVHYSQLESGQVLTSLNYTSDKTYNPSSLVSSPMTALSRNVQVSKYRLDGESFFRYEVGAWNGYWDVRQLDDLTDTPQDSAIAASEDWIVLYNHDLGKFIQMEWQDGTWIRDTISRGWTEPLHSVRLYAGPDYFIALDMKLRCTGCNDFQIRWAYHYQKVDTGWVENLIADFGGYWDGRIFGGLQMSATLYGLVTYDRGLNPVEYQLLYGMYNYQNDLLFKYSTSKHAYMSYAVGPDYVAWGRSTDNILTIYEFDRSGQTAARWLDQGAGIVKIAGMESGVAVLKEAPDPAIRTWMRIENGGDGWGSLTIPLYASWYDLDNNIHSLGGNTLLLREAVSAYQQRSVVFEWGGNAWYSQLIVQNGHDDDTYRATRSAIAFFDYSEADLYVRRRTSFDTWSSLSLLNSNIYYWKTDGNVTPSIAAAKDLVVHGGRSNETTNTRRLYAWDEAQGQWNSINLNSYTDPSTAGAAMVAFRGRVFMDVSGGDPSRFQLNRGSYIGKPGIVHVSSTKLYPTGDISDPAIVTTYEYKGGILDESVNTPRFVLATVASPLHEGDASSTKTYSTSYFYNDLDDDDFTLSGVTIPDLESSSTFGIENGGYMLDGLSYHSFVDTLSPSEPVAPELNQNWQYPSIAMLSDHTDASPVIHIDSSLKRTELATSKQRFEYDNYNRRFKTTKSMFDSLLAVDSVVYWDQFSYPPGENVKESFSYLWDTVSQTIEYRGRGATDWHTRTHADSSLAFRDAYDPTSSYVTSQLASDFPNKGVDEYGNLRVWIESNGDTSSAKYSPDGEFLIASIANGFVNNVFLYDAEYDEDTVTVGFDSWRFIDGNPSSLSSFTGSKSVQTIASYSEERIGVRRTVMADSLASNDYVVSFWHRWNDSIFVQITEFDAGASCASRRYWTIGSGDWSLSNKVVELATCMNLDSVWIEIGIRNGIDNPIGFPPSEWVKTYIDDIRVHPIGTQLATHTSVRKYSNGIGVITTESGLGNLPSRTERDYFGRVVAVRDHLGELLSSNQYVFSTTPDTLSLHCSGGPGTSQAVMQLDDLVTYTLNVVGEAYMEILLNGQSIDYLECPGPCIDTSSSGSFTANAGETVMLKGNNVGGGSANGQAIYRIPGYNKDNPNYVKTTVFRESGPTITISYTDGLGTPLQARSETEWNGATSVVVTGCNELDGRGRQIKNYKPYIDLVTPTGLEDLTDSASVAAEVDEYYDGADAVDCGGYAYSETAYHRRATGRVAESSLPGPYHRKGQGHTTTFDDTTIILGLDTVRFEESIDADGIKSASRSHAKGKYSTGITYFSGGTDSTLLKTTPDVLDQLSTTAINIGANDVDLRKTFSNDLGQADSTWKLDYGIIRMLYDQTGQLRFMQNDNRASDNNFVYYKYDKLGRRVEEGLVSGIATNFVQAKADDVDFPTPSHNPSVKYRWYYDYHVAGSETLNAPGELVRVESGDLSYYRNFYYSREEREDSVVVRLPYSSPSGTSLKSIVHRYNVDGSMNQMVIYPHLDSTASARTFNYEYDAAGRLKRIVAGDTSHSVGIIYAEYEYNADGSARSVRQGVFDTQPEFVSQRIDYAYDPLSRIIAINHADSVYQGGANQGEDLFGQNIIYNSGDTAGYFNGRIFGSNNTISNTVLNTYNSTYGCDDRSWLDSAVNTDGTYREYKVDDFGRRYSMYTESDTIDYVYGEILGSSQLWEYGDSAFGFWQRMFYDNVGNLVADSTHEMYRLDYDYRNLNTYVLLPPPTYPPRVPYGAKNTITMSYDEAGLRLRKDYDYYSLVQCEPDTNDPELDPMGMMAMGGQLPTFCWEEQNSGTYYLYDGGVLIATFYGNDNVRDIYVNGSNGVIASYWQNNNDYLIWWLKDYLGSTRVRYVADHTTGFNTVFERVHYYPYGETKFHTSSSPNNLLFTGKEQDTEGPFDLYYFGSRYYSTGTGHFTSIDKAGQFANGYLYGGNNPTLGTDPDGNLFFLATPFLVGAATGAWWGYVGEDMKEGPINWGKVFGHAVTGGIAGTVTNAVSSQFKSAILSQGVGSSINSLGGVILDGGDFSVNLGFGTLGKGGFAFNNPGGANSNPVSSIGGVLGWMSAAEDLGQIPAFRGETAREMQARQLKAKANSPDPSDKSTYIKEGEVDLTVDEVDLDAIDNAAYRRTDDPYFHVSSKGKVQPYVDDHIEPQFRFGGHLHLDTRGYPNDPTKWYWHYDAMGSGSKNIFTILHHPLFESEASKLPRFIRRIPYQVYRQSYMLNVRF